MPSFLDGTLDQPTLVRWTQELVRHPSPQTEFFEAEPAVLALIDGIAGRLEELGLPHSRDAMGNLIVEIGPQSKRGVLLMAYAMTHPASNMEDPYGGEIIDAGGEEAIRGRGIAEQKGSLVAALAATYAAHKRGNLTGRLIFTVSTAGETGRHDAARSILDTLPIRPDAAVIAIGTTGRVSLGNKGRIDVLVTVRGRPAHSSTPWEGLDAIAGARQAMERLDRINFGGRRHAGLGEVTLSVISIRSFPLATHTIQGEVRMTLDRRLLPGDQPEEAMAQIKSALYGLDPFTVDVELGPVMFPSEVAESSRLIQSIKRGNRDRGLAEPSLFYSHGSLDAGLFAREGIDATMWGPGDMAQWHSNNEFIRISDLCRGATAYDGFIRDYLGN